MEKIRMPDKDKLYTIIKSILESQHDVEIRPLPSGEVAIYKLERRKQKIDA